jgi:hypothetical protein
MKGYHAMDIETRIAHLEAACARGWMVFPCNGKVPATRSGVYSGSDDIVKWRTQWRQRPDWNIGIWTGGSGLLVVDCDLDDDDPTSWAVNAFKRAGLIDDGPFGDDGSTIDAHKPGPTPGISDWLEICDANDFDTEDTYCVVTPGNGLHAYFSYDTDKHYIAPGTGVLGELVDIRASGSYVVGVGSEVDGHEYEACGSAHVLPAPAWLIDMLEAKPKTPQAIAKSVEDRIKDEKYYNSDSIQFMAFMCNDIATAPIGQRNTTFAHKLWRVWMAGGNESDLDILAGAAREAGLDDREIAAAIKAVTRNSR